ncbi:MAG: PPC domain-containing DNA-binding protein [Thermodesulfobacteriota bacterium]|nr:PPC domain-containing DNA-binding protein [Thermodesulfobacteriota bacterium]
MEYRKGTVGRVFTVRFDHGENLLEGLNKLIIKENIRCGWFHVLGGMQKADVVIGPKEPVMPPEPVWNEICDTREVLGTGSIFWENEEPKIHLHSALGHHGETITACVRKNTKTYLILEVFIIEISGINAARPWFEDGGFNRLTFS